MSAKDIWPTMPKEMADWYDAMKEDMPPGFDPLD